MSLLRGFGLFLVAMTGTGIGTLAAHQCRMRGKEMQRFRRLLQRLQSGMVQDRIPFPQLAIGAEFPVFSQGSSAAELAKYIPQGYSDALRQEITLLLQNSARQPAEQLGQSFALVLVRCRDEEQAELQQEAVVCPLCLRMGICLGILAAVLLW